MQLMIGVIIILVSLFALAYATKRRFGLLGLALCAGVVLSRTWTASLTPFLQQQGFHSISPPLNSVVATLLLVLPAVLCMTTGPIYSKPWGRLIGAFLFTAFAFVLLLEPLGTTLLLEGFNSEWYNSISTYSATFIVICTLLALADILLMRLPKKRKGRSEH